MNVFFVQIVKEISYICRKENQYSYKMDFLSLSKARCSVRKYDFSRPIEQEKLDYIMECVRFAPSAVNFQPWKFLIAKEKNVLEAISSCYANEWIKTAPCIIVACVDHRQSWHRQRYDNKDHADKTVDYGRNSGKKFHRRPDQLRQSAACKFRKINGAQKPYRYSNQNSSKGSVYGCQDERKDSEFRI